VGTLSILRSSDQNPSPSVGPGALESEVIDQRPTLHEQWAEVVHSEVGGLGFLFGHAPEEHYPAPLETSPEPTIEPDTLAAMTAGAREIAVTTPQPTPAPELVTPHNGPWSFADIFRNEVKGARTLLAGLGGPRGN
jgi:hypothetical protein